MTTKILVVDDDPTMSAMIAGHLATAGYQVASASNGPLAIDLAKEEKPELVLLDIMMPGMDGFTVCKEIRGFSEVPIIILTAKGEQQDLVRGLDVGADDYVLKPFSAAELLARVRAVLRRVGPLGLEDYHHRVFRHHELEIDVDRARVTRSGEEIRVSATEFKILVMLAASAGNILSTDQLLAAIWGSDYREEREVLWVSLSRLRQKVEPDPKNPIHIVTRPGLGYEMPAVPAPSGLSSS